MAELGILLDARSGAPGPVERSNLMALARTWHRPRQVDEVIDWPVWARSPAAGKASSRGMGRKAPRRWPQPLLGRSRRRWCWTSRSTAWTRTASAGSGCCSSRWPPRRYYRSGVLHLPVESEISADRDQLVVLGVRQAHHRMLVEDFVDHATTTSCRRAGRTDSCGSASMLAMPGITVMNGGTDPAACVSIPAPHRRADQGGGLAGSHRHLVYPHPPPSLEEVASCKSPGPASMRRSSPVTRHHGRGSHRLNSSAPATVAGPIPPRARGPRRSFARAYCAPPGVRPA